jgi:hypothetical protein
MTEDHPSAVARVARRVWCWLGFHGPVQPCGLHRMYCFWCRKEFSE